MFFPSLFYPFSTLFLASMSSFTNGTKPKTQVFLPSIKILSWTFSPTTLAIYSVSEGNSMVILWPSTQPFLSVTSSMLQDFGEFYFIRNQDRRAEWFSTLFSSQDTLDRTHCKVGPLYLLFFNIAENRSVQSMPCWVWGFSQQLPINWQNNLRRKNHIPYIACNGPFLLLSHQPAPKSWPRVIVSYECSALA